MFAIAPILAQGHGSIQFVVDAVEPCQQANWLGNLPAVIGQICLI